MTIDIEKLAEEAGAYSTDTAKEVYLQNDEYIFIKNSLINFAEAYAAKVHDKRVGELEAKNRELSASINDLHEAINTALSCVDEEINPRNYNGEILTKFINDYGEMVDILQEALSKTPAQSLQEFENEVIERCAKVCEEIVIENPGRADLTVDQCAKTIRALKVT